jgi:hypothetical protein
MHGDNTAPITSAPGSRRRKRNFSQLTSHSANIDEPMAMTIDSTVNVAL